MTDSLRIQFHESGDIEVTTDNTSKTDNIFPLIVAVLVLLYFLLRKSQSFVTDGRVHFNYEFILSSSSTSLGDLSLNEEENVVNIGYSLSVASEYRNVNEQSIDSTQSMDFSYDFLTSHSLVSVGESVSETLDAVTSSLSFLIRLGELEDNDPLPPPDDAVWIVIPY